MGRAADIRWFAPNSFCRLVVPGLRAAGLSVALEGNKPAALALAMSGTVAEHAWRYARPRRCPLILYLWDLPPWRLAGGRPDAVVWLFGRFVGLPRIGGRYAEQPRYYSRLRYLAERAREVWAPSESSAASVAARFGIAARRVPYCYDSDRFTPLPDGQRGEALLTVSRLVPHKNQAVVVRAAARCVPPRAVRLIGHGPERAALERLGAALSVPLAIAGGVDAAGVVAAYREAAVVVCPSRFEGFGVTPLEATACGAPVVASDIAPHREFAAPGARFFPPDDVDALVDAVGRAAHAPAADPAPLRDLTIGAAAARICEALRPHLAGG